jgi:rubrerythrin
MMEEQDTTLGALQTAIKMEIDGKEYYLKASQSSRNELGRELLEKLAAEEDDHRLVFERIYKDISAQKSWPEKAYQGDGGRGLRTVFARALETMNANVNAMISIKVEADRPLTRPKSSFTRRWRCRKKSTIAFCATTMNSSEIRRPGSFRGNIPL